MSLQPGDRLGVFEILGPLGAGGMGEVYRARDTRLGREVAIKVLPPAFSGDPLRVTRFEREARMLAAINHPGIAAIYGAEEAGDIPYIVMELVPGDTLAAWMARGPVSLEEALSFARQIAEALEAAHAQGVVHRDLKPSNIKITPEGKVKVLDLGLAKAIEVPQGPIDLSRSPTAILQDETRPGVILGTVEFMSPEQARGKEIDRRTDIWAFGCVLFEMLSGRRAFSGETVSDILVAILTQPPQWSLLPAYTPARLRDLLVRCLERDPERRLGDMREARVELEQIAAAREETRSLDGERRPPVPFRRRLGFLLGSAAIVLAAAGWFGLRAVRSRTPVSSVSRSLVVLPFRDLSNSPQGQLLGDGLVETISARLSRVPGIQIVTPSEAVAAADRVKEPLRAAQSLGATLLLRGAIQREGERLRITYSVLRVPEGLQLAGDDVTGSASELFALQDEVTGRVAAALHSSSGPPPIIPSGLETAGQQERYFRALGLLQRYDKPASVDEALRLLESLAIERPEAALVACALGRAQLYKFNLTRDRAWAERAASAVARARQLAPNLPEAHETEGELLVRSGKPREAIAAFRRALALSPNSYEAVLGLARAYDGAGDAAEAEATYRRAIALQPGFWSGYSKLAGSYFNRGDYAHAIEMFRRVTELSPDNSRALGNLGASYQMAGDFDRALEAYRRSLTLAPTSLAYSNVGTLEYALGHYKQSADAFEKAVELTPGHFQFWANLGDARRWSPGLQSKSAEAYARAIELAHSELKVNARDPLVLAYLGACLAKIGKTAEAREEMEKAVALAPRHPQVLYLAGIEANLTGRTAEALQRIRGAAEAGYSRAIIARDPELKNLRGSKDFQNAIGRS